VDLANERGGPDNVSAIVCRVLRDDPAPPSPLAPAADNASEALTAPVAQVGEAGMEAAGGRQSPSNRAVSLRVLVGGVVLALAALGAVLAVVYSPSPIGL
jgi:hypothetical protein